MHTQDLGPIEAVSRVTLGGGGLGELWGETTPAEAIATLNEAVEAGINLIDTAPLYKNCEAVIGAAFQGRPPQGLRFTSKVYLGSPPAGEVAGRIEAALAASLAAMRLERLDLYFLHTNICPDGYIYARGAHRQANFATFWSLYRDEVIPAFERLKAQGRIGAWGITATGVPATILQALAAEPRPQVCQAVSNLLDSIGDMRSYAEPPQPRAIIAEAVRQGVGVMGIRAVQAGALTRAIDRELHPRSAELADYARAAPYRALCEAWGADPALVAHRYALGMEGVDTLILGVKNREELRQCLEAERLGPLSAEEVAAVDALGLSAPQPV
ncbi:aldo/keto reductase [Phenylobacterium montanum]|uniref:Aldo/keto reductase n=1 Tax=Phenylobacterium montanum TaxID=2823693 RepID=A0A975IU36_9CAUL|nr:aldo/keto reductase [Caulobacter sp. S6]QUD87393.1 aldo/keto reductase [Caulobacter sp. S6]